MENSLNSIYEDLTDPRELIKYIDNFENWLSLATDIIDLKFTLKAFEKAEMYEQCEIIRNKINKYEKTT